MNISLLKSDKTLTKRFNGAEIINYSNSYSFTHIECPVENIEELYDLLKAISTESDICIVRGEKICEESANIQRTINVPKNFRENPKGVDWVMIDFDAITAPQGSFTRLQYADYLVGTLPEYMHNSSYVVQWSSKAGIDNWKTLRCHIWFWLETARTDSEAKRWADSVGITDLSVYNPVQIHYTAAPIFENGAIDPIGINNRCVLIHKEKDTVDIPLITAPSIRKVLPGKYVPVGMGDDYGFQKKLKSIGHPHMHSAITEAIGSWISRTGSNSNLTRLKERIREAIENAPINGSCGKAFYQSDKYLNEQIRGCHFQHKANGPSRMPETKKEFIIYKMSHGTSIGE